MGQNELDALFPAVFAIILLVFYSPFIKAVGSWKYWPTSAPLAL